MRNITPYHMVGFNDELQKTAGWASSAWRAAGNTLRPVGRFVRSVPGKATAMAAGELGGRYGRQLGLGAGLGAIGGAAIADPDEPGSRLRGALHGAALGSGVAGARILATGKGREAAKKGLSNFYQRQRYGLTGQGLGKTDKERLAKAREIGLIDKMDPKITDAKRLAAEKARIGMQEEAFQKGYMSAPGVVHGLLTKPGDTMRSGWKRSGALGKVFTGLGAYEAGKGLIEKPEPGGPGRLEKGMRGAGSALGWMVAPSTLVGGQILGMGGEGIGRQVGKIGDRAVASVRSRVKPRGES